MVSILKKLFDDTRQNYEDLSEKPRERINAMLLQCFPLALVLGIMAYCTMESFMPLSVLFLSMGYVVMAFLVFVLLQDVPRVLEWEIGKKSQ
jgi:hypothetical protein